jgi:hypothetical protein
MSVVQEMPPCSANATSDNNTSNNNNLDWTTFTVLQAISIFLLSGLAEVDWPKSLVAGWFGRSFETSKN